MSLELFDLSGRRALVTGSSQGIGLALAEGLAAHGAEVVLNGRDPARLDAAAERLAGAGYRVGRATFDVTDPEAVAAGVAAVEAEGPIDILVNNAGMQFRTPLEDFPVDKWQQLLTTNVSSVFYVGQAVARAHDPAWARQDHQHRLGAERARPTRDRALHRDQGRGAQPHPRHGDRLGEVRAAGQRHRARLLQDAAEPGAGRQRRVLRLAGEAHARRRAGAMSTSWSARRSSSPATPPPS